MTQITIQDAFRLAVQHHEAGRLDEAERIYRMILGVLPEHPESLLHLGVMAHQRGQSDIGVEMMRRAIALKPGIPEAHCNLGNILSESGRHAEAIIACRQAIALRPDFAGAYLNLAVALKGAYQIEEAIAAFRQAIALDPNLAEAHNSLGSVLVYKGDLDGGVEAYRRALAVKPGLSPAYCNLGAALLEKGELDDAIAAFRQAIALDPSQVHAHSNLIFAMLFHPSTTGQGMVDELRRWEKKHAEPLRHPIPAHANDRDPERRLRIGYVSADFFAHASANFLLPLFEHHDPGQVEIFCYAQVAHSDATTLRLKQQTAQWRSTVGMSGEQLAAQIREDRIDILVDLKVHSAENRLDVFARKPAPVQVTWLGYPGSTGLKTIDYRLSDPHLDPPGTDESVYTEKTYRLPYSFWCYDPREERSLSVNALPALENGGVTFACLNNFCKINDGSLALWANLMNQVPGSRLILLAQHGTHRQKLLDQINHLGIDPGRIEFSARLPRQDYMRLYHRIDLGLDTLPYNGHTTTLDAFWMGVPVVSRSGATAVGRGGRSHLFNIGLPELTAYSDDQYIQIAVQLARDLPRLSALRATLRQRLEQSPLMDAPKFARSMESAYRQFWRAWCAASF